MKPGGIIRLTTPDLELWIYNYHKKRSCFFKSFYRLAPSKPDLKTNGEILIGQAYGWGHKWLYDFESLKRLLEEAGFKSVLKKKHLSSLINEIELIEPVSKLRKMETMYIEAKK